MPTLRGLGDQMKRVVEWAEANGWEVGCAANNHLRMTHPKVSRVLFSSGTPRCPHVYQNAIHEMQRAMRACGLQTKKEK